MVHRVKNNTFASNSYLVSLPGNSECIVVDPGLDSNAIEAKITELGLRPRWIIATHGHFDHVGSVTVLQKKYKATFVIHEKDLKIMKMVNFFLKIMKIEMVVETPVPDQLISGTDGVLALDEVQVQWYNYPGHTDGSCVFRIGDDLFTGDTLYANNLGVNPFPGQDKSRLKISLREILQRFDEDLIVYPGHGGSAQLSQIKNENTALINFIEAS